MTQQICLLALKQGCSRDKTVGSRLGSKVEPSCLKEAWPLAYKTMQKARRVRVWAGIYPRNVAEIMGILPAQKGFKRLAEFLLQPSLQDSPARQPELVMRSLAGR